LAESIENLTNYIKDIAQNINDNMKRIDENDIQNKEQDNRIKDNENKNIEQDNTLDDHENRLTELENKVEDHTNVEIIKIKTGISIFNT
jgi:chromosome segregation ATPase